MNRLRRGVVLGILLLIGVGCSAKAEVLTSFVVDEAGIFSAAEVKELNAAQGRLKSAHEINLVILSITKLEGASIEEYANRRFRLYKIGQEGVDNGLLFLIVKDDRQMRLEVGYGLEGSLPDLQVKRLLDLEVRPFFQKARYAEGCLHLINRLAGEQVEIQHSPRGAQIPWLIRFLPLGISVFFSLFVYFVGYREAIFPDAEKLDEVFGSSQWPEEARKYKQRERSLVVIKILLLWLYSGLILAGIAVGFFSRVDWWVASAVVANFLTGFLFIFLYRVIPFSCKWRVWHDRYPEPIKSRITPLLKTRGSRYSKRTERSVDASSASGSRESSGSSSPSRGGDSGGGGANSNW